MSNWNFKFTALKLYLIIGGLSLITFQIFKLFNIEIGSTEEINPNTHLEENFKKSYRGIVVSKFSDRHNHNYETIELRLNDGSTYKWVPHGDHYNTKRFYDFIRVNDSIIKTDWGFKYSVKRGASEIFFNNNPS